MNFINDDNNDADFAKVCQQVTQAANKSELLLRDFAKEINNVLVQIREALIIVQHNPSRLPEWQGLAATPEGGCIGQIRWINSMPSEEAWGRTWWSKCL